MLSCVTLMGSARITAASQFKIFRLHFVSICDPRGHPLSYDFFILCGLTASEKGRKKILMQIQEK